MKQIHFLVSGHVQGVCFRHYSAKKATELGIVGYAKNLNDGRVEIFAEGENQKINAFFSFCKNNPGHSFVEEVKVITEKKINRASSKAFAVI